MSGFSFDVEVLMMAQRRGYRIAEVPVNWTHQPGSKVQPRHRLRAHERATSSSSARRYLRGEYNTPHLAPWPEPASAGSTPLPLQP